MGDIINLPGPTGFRGEFGQLGPLGETIKYLVVTWGGIQSINHFSNMCVMLLSISFYSHAFAPLQVKKVS